MKFQRKYDALDIEHGFSQVIEAEQWFKNGDHSLDYSRSYAGFDKGGVAVFSSEERKEKIGRET